MERVLILAGTTEATALAHRLHDAGLDPVSSLAGVTSSPVARPGRARRGGFGGAAGLARYLAGEGIEALVDATHPFAAIMPFHAAAAARAVGVPHLRLLRPPWRPVDGDRWISVPSVEAAAVELARMEPARAFLAVGRQSAAVFATCTSVTFVVRAIEPLDDALPGADVVLDRGPFRTDDEVRLMRDRRVEVVVAKNSGGSATAAKLDAARLLRLPVLMVERPPQPAVDVVETVEEAAAWCGLPAGYSPSAGTAG